MSIQTHTTTPNLPAVIFRHSDLAAHYRAVRSRLHGAVERTDDHVSASLQTAEARRSFRLPTPQPAPADPDEQPRPRTCFTPETPTLESRTLDAIEAFERIASANPGRDRTLAALSAASIAWNISERTLLTPCRKPEVCTPRQIAMALARHKGGRTFPDIGRRLGGRDHTTVLHAARKFEALVNGMALWRERFTQTNTLALPSPERAQ